MKTLVAIPTLCRADLLIRNKEFLEGVRYPDQAIILDNGRQRIDIDVQIERTTENLGVPGSWNLFLRRAFLTRDFNALVLLQDDIIWDAEHLASAKKLLRFRKDVDLFLSNLQFSVQVHRRENIRTIGFYDERFHPAYCEDDDYAITMTQKGRVYERFDELNPLPGSISEGTMKPVTWKEQNQKLFEKWGAKAFGVNIPHAPWYKTNKNILDKHPN